MKCKIKFNYLLLILITLTINGCSTSSDNDLSSKNLLEFLNGTKWVADCSDVNSACTILYCRFTDNYARPYEDWAGSTDESCYDYWQSSNNNFEIKINTENTLQIVFGSGNDTYTLLFAKDGDVLDFKMTTVYTNNNSVDSVVSNLILNKTNVNVDGLLVCD